MAKLVKIKEDEYGAWPKTEEELLAYLRSLEVGYKGITKAYSKAIKRGGFDAKLTKEEENAGKAGYQLSAEALYKGAVAAFNYMAHKVGATGFQAEWAELEFVRVTRGLRAPFGILNGENMLYPQYDLRSKVDEWLDDWKEWAQEEAKKKIKESKERKAFIHPNVLEHWKELAEGRECKHRRGK